MIELSIDEKIKRSYDLSYDFLLITGTFLIFGIVAIMLNMYFSGITFFILALFPFLMYVLVEINIIIKKTFKEVIKK